LTAIWTKHNLSRQLALLAGCRGGNSSKMNAMYKQVDWDKLRSALVENGGEVVPEFLDPAIIDQIDKEIAPWLSQINFNEIYGSSILGGDRWIFHLGIASPTALRLALDERVLGLVESIFGEPAILAEFSFQEKIAPADQHMGMHTDGAGGLLVFYYLSGVDERTGGTRFLPGTHEIGQSLQTTPTLAIDKKHYADRMKDVVTVRGGRGTAFFFDQDVWHDLPPYAERGRRVIWSLYQPASRPQRAVDHLYRQSLLATLDERQKRAYGIGQPAFGRIGHFRHIGKQFGLAHARFLLRYLLKFRPFERAQPAAPKKMHENLPRIRSPR
jgi:hypothetical protein